MAGLVPERRNRQDIQRANNRLLKEHNESLRSWIENDTKQRSAAPQPRQQSRKEPDNKGK